MKTLPIAFQIQTAAGAVPATAQGAVTIYVAPAGPAAATPQFPITSPTVPMVSTPVLPVLPPVQNPVAPDALVWTILVGLTLIAMMTLGFAARVLRKTRDWSLASALSESGKSSSSRLIAFAGLMVIALIMLGTGYAFIWRILKGGTAPELGGISAFIVAGGALFTPYIATQIREAMQGPTAPAPQTPNAAPAAVVPRGPV